VEIAPGAKGPASFCRCLPGSCASSLREETGRRRHGACDEGSVVLSGVAEELQRSREQLVAAREEERRRLRRDLHDGVGSSVAAAVLHLQVAEELIRSDPSAAENLIGQVRTGSKALIEEIRRLVDRLGPCALDQLGLVSAIRERASCIAGIELGEGADGHAGVTVEAVGNVEDLPAAIDVAAFHIVSEALTNACRHRTTTRCLVRLSRLASDLEVEVVSEGCHLSEDFRPGTVMASMRERAAELGGTLRVELSPCGRTVLRVRLPLPRG
jgi:two-component system, NarL family, sensor kinase